MVEWLGGNVAAWAVKKKEDEVGKTKAEVGQVSLHVTFLARLCQDCAKTVCATPLSVSPIDVSTLTLLLALGHPVLAVAPCWAIGPVLTLMSFTILQDSKG